MLVLDGFLDALRRRGVAVLAALESRRASLSDSVSAFAVSLSGSARTAALVRRAQPQAYKPQDRLGSLT